MGLFELIIIFSVLSGVGTASSFWWKEVVRRRKIKERHNEKLLQIEEHRIRIEERRYALLERAVETSDNKALALLAKSEEE